MIQISSEPWIYLLYLALDAREYLFWGPARKPWSDMVLHTGSYMRPTTDLAVERVSGLTSCVTNHRVLARWVWTFTPAPHMQSAVQTRAMIPYQSASSPSRCCPSGAGGHSCDHQIGPAGLIWCSRLGVVVMEPYIRHVKGCAITAVSVLLAVQVAVHGWVRPGSSLVHLPPMERPWNGWVRREGTSRRRLAASRLRLLPLRCGQ